MRSAGLFKHDHQTGKDGYTLAAILLFGKDEVIQSVLPHHKTDAILRVENTDRYDDRDDIRTNLIESYDRLMAFVRKHLPDKFYLEGDQRVSLRDRIFREVASNILIHREYANAFPAKLIIEKDKVFTENWNRPHYGGVIDPTNFSPYPKNPVIAKFFKEIGRVDELGSGVRNTFKYCGIYTPGTNPEFIEDDVFRTVIPLKAEESIKSTRIYDAVSDAVNDAVSDAVKERLGNELIFIIARNGISLDELKKHFNIERATAQRDMKRLKGIGWVDFMGAPKTGKYILTEKGKTQLAGKELPK